MKHNIIIVALALSILVAHVHAEEHGKIAIQSEVLPLTLTDFATIFNSSNLIPEPSYMIGLRFYTSDKIGVDVLSGLIFSSSVTTDTASDTRPNPGVSCLSTQVGVAYTALQGEKASLAILGRLGVTFNEVSEVDYSESDPKYATYNILIPSLFIGFEPSIEVSKNIHIFSNLGVKTVFLPNSKYIDMNDPSYNNGTDSFPLKNRKDAATRIVTNGILLGFRYFF